MRVRLTIFFLFLISRLIAQEPPELCAVSVDTSFSRPVLYWTVKDTSGIDGFIVKRIIWDGTGVMNGTLNNVAVLSDPHIRSFIDTSDTYNTHAAPWQRSEQYVVVSFHDTAGFRTYSGFSQKLSTIFLTADYDSCSTIITLKWTTNQSVIRYLVYSITAEGLHRLASTQDTQFFYNPVVPGYYRFIIKAVVNNSCHVDTILSNIAWVKTGLFEHPSLLYIQGVSAVGKDTLSARLHIHLPPDKPSVELWMDRSQIASFDSDYDSDFIINASNSELHTLQLRAISTCGVQIDSSSIAHNIVLSGQYEQSGQQAEVNLAWNNYDYCAGQVGPSEVYFSTDGQNFTLLASSQQPQFTHLLNSLISSQTLPSTLYYFVSIAEQSDSLVGQTIEVRSNVVAIKPPPILLMPNAINPLSPNEQDRIFTVNVNFIDSYEITVFDRYGRVLFHSTDPAKGWDGRGRDGKLVPVDTYFYLLKYRAHGKEYKKRGSVSVIY